MLVHGGAGKTPDFLVETKFVGMKVAVRRGYAFLETSVVDAVQVRDQFYEKQCSINSSYVMFMQDLYLCLNLNDLQLQSSGSSYGDGGFRSFQRRPGFKADSKSYQVGSSSWLLRQELLT